MGEQDKEKGRNDDIRLGIADESQSNIYNNSQNLQVTEEAQLTITNVYHISEIQQNEKIIEMAKKMVWFGFGVIALCIIFALTENIEGSFITGAVGVIMEFISAIVFGFVTLSNKNKLQYFNQLSIGEEGDKLMQLILTMDNKKAKEKMIDKMVTNYCERRT